MEKEYRYKEDQETLFSDKNLNEVKPVYTAEQQARIDRNDTGFIFSSYIGFLAAVPAVVTTAVLNRNPELREVEFLNSLNNLEWTVAITSLIPSIYFFWQREKLQRELDYKQLDLGLKVSKAKYTKPFQMKK